ncbi:MAG: nucleotidyltransferase domain-containing protein [Chlorobiaceae bacterium]|nr:nucleotidyltransferase domain-containing protein [Chlorobiaceae bacterium]
MATIEQQLSTVLEKHGGIRFAILFGSLAKGTAGFESDVDLAVDAGRPLDVEAKIGLIGELALATGRPVDLIDLTTVGEPLLGQILAGGKRILGSAGRQADLRLRHLYNLQDFVPYQQRLLEQRRIAWIGK